MLLMQFLNKKGGYLQNSKMIEKGTELWIPNSTLRNWHANSKWGQTIPIIPARASEHAFAFSKCREQSLKNKTKEACMLWWIIRSTDSNPLPNNTRVIAKKFYVWKGCNAWIPSSSLAKNVENNLEKMSSWGIIGMSKEVDEEDATAFRPKH